ncbi:hypothetical protein C5167_032187 [Papaver somniferum]|uniref:Methyltransferase type 11 domain-containing protein n=1 Tax=Papaver somniferum TaxID=3469 RepID=A0A4Y7KA88_PAPSO|nr:putative methyltransferase DDB_G0268948 [Papaver somniferum]RZC69121.1 hypothetical protein C5167_032187 [Papaver somniferum]
MAEETTDLLINESELVEETSDALVDESEMSEEFYDFLSDRPVAEYWDGRPTYLQEWYSMVANFSTGHSRAWDVGTGNGIAAHGIAEFYDEVIATDISEVELEKARPHPIVTYMHTPPSMSDEELISKLGGEASLDVITVAQAIQYFDLPRFYSMVNRVLKPDGVIIVWGYNNKKSEFFFNGESGPKFFPQDLLWERLLESALPYRGPNVRDISDEYKTLPLPFEDVGIGGEGDPFNLIIPTRLTFEGFLEMARAWPDVAAAKDQGVDVLSEELIEEFRADWGDRPVDLIPRPFLFKGFMLAGALKKESMNVNGS